jgi:ATP/maltotriose-dependent transcriptional regulator MalT
MPTVMLGRAQFACGHFGPALAAFDEVRAALGEDVPRGSVFGGSLNQTVASRVWSAFALAEMGRMSAAHDAVEECDGLLPQVSMNRQDALWVALAAGRIAALLENPEEVVGRLAPFAEMCETEFPVYLGRLAMSLGPARVMLGSVDEGLDMLDRAAEVADRKRFLFLRGLLHAEHAHALTLAGRPAAATDAARGAVAEAERCGDAGSLAWARLRHAEACAAMGDRGAARVARAAVECARAGGMRPVLDRCAALLR